MSATSFISGMISYTTWLSGEIEALEQTDEITIVVAPAWYAPTLPRPFANVGWTFEQYSPGIDSGQRFTLASWAALFGYMVSLPFQLVKSLWLLVSYLGPFGLFLGWLLIMFGMVAVVKILKLFYHLMAALIDLVVKIIDLIGQYLPTGG